MNVAAKAATRGRTAVLQRACAACEAHAQESELVERLDLMDKHWPRDAKGNAWQVHHGKPLAFGGDNSPNNLFPLPRGTRKLFSDWWSRRFFWSRAVNA